MDTEATVYKAKRFLFLEHEELKLETDPLFDRDDFETKLEIEEGSDHSILLEMLAELNDFDNDFAIVFDTYFDRDSYLTWMATNILFKNSHAVSDEYFLYRPTDSKKHSFFPWDYDGSFDDCHQPDRASRPDCEGPWKKKLTNWWRVVLHERFIREPGFVDELTARVTELRDSIIAQDLFDQFISIYTDMIRDIVLASPDFDDLPAFDDSSDQAIIDEHDAEVNRLVEGSEGLGMINDHYEIYLETLEDPMGLHTFVTVNGDDDVDFSWDESFDIQGDEITYDLQISSDPAFEAGDILHEELGLTTTSYNFTEFVLLPGTYFFRVTVKDAKGNTQIPYDRYFDNTLERYFFGVKSFVIS